VCVCLCVCLCVRACVCVCVRACIAAPAVPQAEIIADLYRFDAQPKRVLRRLLFIIAGVWRKQHTLTEVAPAGAGSPRRARARANVPKVSALFVDLLHLRPDFPCAENAVTKDEAVEALLRICDHPELSQLAVFPNV
jgi:hypothetical protein